MTVDNVQTVCRLVRRMRVAVVYGCQSRQASCLRASLGPCVGDDDDAVH